MEMRDDSRKYLVGYVEKRRRRGGEGRKGGPSESDLPAGRVILCKLNHFRNCIIMSRISNPSKRERDEDDARLPMPTPSPLINAHMLIKSCGR